MLFVNWRKYSFQSCNFEQHMCSWKIYKVLNDDQGKCILPVIIFAAWNFSRVPIPYKNPNSHTDCMIHLLETCPVSPLTVHPHLKKLLFLCSLTTDKILFTASVTSPFSHQYNPLASTDHHCWEDMPPGEEAYSSTYLLLLQLTFTRKSVKCNYLKTQYS